MAEHPEDAGASPPSPVPQPRNLPRPHLEAPPAKPVSAKAEALVQLAAVVRTLSATVNRQDDAAEEAAAGRTLPKGHRFQRAAGPVKPTDVSATDEPAPGQAPETGPELQPAPRPTRAKNTATGTPRRTVGMAALREHPFFVWVVVQIFCCGLVLLGVLLGETESGPGPPKSPAASPATTFPHPAAAASGAVLAASSVATEHALHTVDSALAKEDAGDLNAAGILLESLADSPKAPPGTDYQLALLALRRGDRANAALHLEHSIVANEAVAPCCYLRAALAGAQGDYREASIQLGLAAHAEPFDGRYFFYWGEALRRNGQLPEAVACLQRALARPCTVQDRELYYFKLRLAQVEAGRGDPFAAELEEKLRQPSVSGDWLLLAAAQNVQREVIPAAIEFLRRAAHQLPPVTYRTWVSDYAFQNHANEQEIARFLLVPPPTPAVVLGIPGPAPAIPADSVNPPDAATVPIAPVVAPSEHSDAPASATMPPDPTVCSPAQGDPALWRSTAPKSGQ